MIDYDKVQFDILEKAQSIEPSKELEFSNDDSTYFGLSFSDFYHFVSEMKNEGWISGSQVTGFVRLGPITFSGRKRLEELRLILRNRCWYIRTWNWIWAIWWVHIPILICIVKDSIELLNLLLKSFNLHLM